jgi:hypothetical protein
VPSQPAATPQERNTPEGATRAASSEIQEAEENSGAALPQGTVSGEAHVLELACAPWAATFEAGDDTEDDEEAAVCNTLEHGLAWARRAFDELILPMTSVSFLVGYLVFRFPGSFEKCRSPLTLFGADPRGVRSEVSAHDTRSSTQSGLSWRCSSS